MIRLYLKQAWELLRQNRLFSTLYIIGTGLSIAMTMVIAVIYYVKWAPIYPETNRPLTLVAKSANVYLLPDKRSCSSYCYSYQVVEDWFYMLKIPEVVTAISEGNGREFIISMENGDEAELQVKLVDANFWRMFDFRFLEGKPFTQEEWAGGVKQVVVASGTAFRLFGTVERVVGCRVMLNGHEYSVCGVVKDAGCLTPVSFGQLYIPYTSVEGYAGERGQQMCDILGEYSIYMKARNSADMPKVKAEVEDVFRKYNASQDKFEFTSLGQPDPYWKSVFRLGGNTPVDYMGLVKLYGSILFALLIIPAINLSGMISSRMEKRLSEMGIRKAFGASRSSLLKQVIWENLLLTCIGGLLGLVVSYVAVFFTRNWVFTLFERWPIIPPEGVQITLSPEVLFSPLLFGCMFLLCVVLNLLSALFPAWRSLRKEIVYSLNEQK